MSTASSSAIAHVRAAPPSRPAIAALATAPVSLIALALGVVLLLTSGGDGYFADELYFLAAGDHLAWGYVDQPPGLPLLATAMDTLFPGSVTALRLPAVLAAVAAVFVTALTARELGGDPRAQVLAAGACAVARQFVFGGHYLLTWSIDPVLWSVVLWLVVRWVRLHTSGRGGDRPLLWAGLATALALQVKLLIPALWAGLGVSVLITGPRRMLTRPLLWVGAGISVVCTLPTLLWQALHGWPQLAMTRVVATETASSLAFLRTVIGNAGLVGAVLALLGLWRLLRSPALRPYRFLGWTVVGLTVLFVLSGGRSYYVAGFYPVLFAVGASELQRRREVTGTRRWGWITWPAYAVSACLVGTVLPLPYATGAGSSGVFERASTGWRQVTAAVARAHRQLPSGRRAETAIVTSDYWSASAIHHYGPAFGIDEVYSPSRGFWYFGHPSPGTERVLYLGGDRDHLRRFFGQVRRVATVDTSRPTYYEGAPIWLARDPKQPWPQLWRELRHLSLWSPRPAE